MAIHPPLYPFKLGDNEAYLYMMEQFEIDRTDNWSIDFLIDQFGRVCYNELIDNAIVVLQPKERVRLSFKVVGTAPNLIYKYISRDLHTFHELKTLIPKCSSYKLKNYLAFLTNFSMAQLVVLPSSTIPVIGADGVDHIEEKLNQAFQFTDRIEQGFLYSQSLDDGVNEFRQLAGL